MLTLAALRLQSAVPGIAGQLKSLHAFTIPPAYT